MDVRDAICQRLITRFTRMRQAFERFDDSQAEAQKVGPKWNVRDLAGHLVYWDLEAAAQVTRVALGNPVPAYDFDRVNDEVFRKNRRMSFVMLLPQLRAAEERLLAAIRSVPVNQLLEGPLRDWVDSAGADHYDHHWPGLDAACRALG